MVATKLKNKTRLGVKRNKKKHWRKKHRLTTESKRNPGRRLLRTSRSKAQVSSKAQLDQKSKNEQAEEY